VVCRRAIPIIVRANLNKSERWEMYPLEVNISVRAADNASTGYNPIYAVIAGRHLPNFVNLINSEHSTLRNMKLESQLILTYRQYTSNNPVIKDLLVEGIKGLREIPGGSGKSIKILGLSENQRKKVGKATGLPARTFKEIVELGVKIKETGNAYFKTGDYTSARGEYIVAAASIMNIAQDVIQEGGETCGELSTLLVNLHTNESLIATRQGDHKLAIEKAEKAWNYAEDFPGGYITPPAQKAKLLFRLGSAFADDGQYRNATDYLGQACGFAPGNVGMKDKLNTVVMLRDSN